MAIPRKPRPAAKPPTKREKSKFIAVPQLRVRMELVLDFDRPISLLKAREAARRLMDNMEITAVGFESPEEFAQATLRSGEFRRVMQIATPEREDPKDELS